MHGWELMVLCIGAVLVVCFIGGLYLIVKLISWMAGGNKPGNAPVTRPAPKPIAPAPTRTVFIKLVQNELLSDRAKEKLSTEARLELQQYLRDELDRCEGKVPAPSKPVQKPAALQAPPPPPPAVLPVLKPAEPVLEVKPAPLPIIILTPSELAAQKTEAAPPPPVVSGHSAALETITVDEVKLPTSMGTVKVETPSVPAPPEQPAKIEPEVPAQPKRSNSERIRSAYAKLHQTAQAPVPPEPAAPSNPAEQAIPESVRKAEIAAAVWSESLKEKPAPKASPVPKAPPKPWTERLFTPENVRILQSLGIAIIFISTATFIHAHMWESASAFMRIAILLAGTTVAGGVGFALRKWTQLRIAGLAFLVLAHLTLLLDAYAALMPVNDHAVYPYSAESLWTLLFGAFSISSLWHSKKLEEPIFNAFAFFGGLVAWVSASAWAGLEWSLWPGMLVFPMLAGGVFALRHKSLQTETRGLQRWSLPWWFECGAKVGGGLLLAILPTVAAYQGAAHLAQHFAWHALFTGTLSAGLLALGLSSPAARGKEGANLSWAIWLGALSFVIPWGLAPYASGWPSPEWCLALCGPGALLLLPVFFKEKEWPGLAPLKTVGLTLMLGGLAWIIGARYVGVSAGANPMFASILLSLAVALIFALSRGSQWAVWSTLGTAAFAVVAFTDRGFASLHDAWPLCWIALAAGWYVYWSSREKSKHELALSAAPHARSGSDCLYLTALLFALTQFTTPLLPNGLFSASDRVWVFHWMVAAPASAAVGYGWSWLALALYPLLTSIARPSTYRRLTGFALMGPATLALLACYVPTTSLVWSGVAIAGVAMALLAWSEFTTRSPNAEGRGLNLLGVGALLLHGSLITILRSFLQTNNFAAWDFVALAIAWGVVAWRMRSVLEGQARFWIQITEGAALLLLAGGTLDSFASGLNAQQWPILMIFTGAWVLVAAKIGELLPTGNSSSEEKPFRWAGTAIASLCATVAFFQLLILINNHPNKPDPWIVFYSLWAGALIPLLLAAREKKSSSESFVTVAGSYLYGSYWVLGTIFAIYALLQPTVFSVIPEGACALFFGVHFLLALVSGYSLKRSFAPITGTLSIGGMALCLKQVWPSMPEGALALMGAAITLGAGTLAKRLHAIPETEGRRTQATTSGIAACATGLITALYLTYGIFEWPGGFTQLYGALGWMLLAFAAWSLPGGFVRFSACLSGLFALTAAAQAERAFGFEPNEMGPGLVAACLVLMAVREFFYRDMLLLPAEQSAIKEELRRKIYGLGISLILASLAGFVFSFLGTDTQNGATRIELAALAFWLTLWMRRTRENVVPGLLTGFELAGFGFLLLGLHSILHGVWDLTIFDEKTAGPYIALVGALVFMIGMALESISGMWVGAESQKQPHESVPFLESRHIVAFGLMLLGVVHAAAIPSLSTLNAANAAVEIWEPLWRACFASAALGIFLSFSRWSNSAAFTQTGRTCSGFLSYMVFLPGSWLFFLKAHSHGGGWGGPAYMLLAPVLFLIAYALEKQSKEKTDEQERKGAASAAKMAFFGAAWVSFGALILSFAANPEAKALMPAIVLGAIFVECLLLRAWKKSALFSQLAAGFFFAMVFFAQRAALGLPAWGASEASPWEWAIMAWAATAVAAFAGGLGWERNKDGISSIGLAGLWLNMISVVIMAGFAFSHGAPFQKTDATLPWEWALIVALFSNTAAAMAAVRWMKLESANWLALLSGIGGYLLAAHARGFGDWEWYTLPPAVFMHAQAWWKIKEAQEKEQVANVSSLLLWGGILAIVPPLVLSFRFTDEGLIHFVIAMIVGLVMIGMAMLLRRKIPLLAGSAGLMVGLLVKTIEWAAKGQILGPVAGIALGAIILGVGILFESRMNQAFRRAVDKAKAEAKMFWVSWR